MDREVLSMILKQLKVIVLIDNGHGFNTAGKRSPLSLGKPQLMEYQFNRDITAIWKNQLDSLGVESILLVPETIDVSLEERVKRANKLTREYRTKGYFVFGVSVHGNAGGGTGWEVFTSVGYTPADPIATTFWETAADTWRDKLTGRMRKDLSDGDVDKESQFYILRETIAPFILTENFFYDHPKDLAFMRTTKAINEIAYMHTVATYRYIIKHFRDMNYEKQAS